MQSGVPVLVPPDGAATLKTRQPRQMANNPLARSMRTDLATEAGRALYRMRQAMVEPVIGYIKAVRGFRRFALRGLNRVRAEWRIILHYTQSAKALPPSLAPTERLSANRRVHSVVDAD
jgi:hypothetical protein